MRKYSDLRANIALGLIFVFFFNSLGPTPTANAEPIYGVDGEFHLPAPGILVPLSPEFNPPILKGIKVHPDNPFRFDFILDQGDGTFASPSSSVIARNEVTKQSFIKEEATKLIKYFLASLTIPEQDLWVNLSPYEKDRIIPQSFGLTEMGRDLLAEDYMLKQITASLIYPEGEVGKKFWTRIYEEAAKKFGTTNIPVNTFNKVWIVPDKAVVYENAKAGTAYVVESKLKVMLEQDYLSLEKHNANLALHSAISNDVASVGANIIREIVIPELDHEVNEDKNFAQLRQVYNSLILATWYKNKIKDSIWAEVYADKKKIRGVGYDNSVILSEAKDLKVPLDYSATPQNDTELIYQRYLQAFKKGVFDYIREEPFSLSDPPSKKQGIFPRKYFSGGLQLEVNPEYVHGFNPAMVNSNQYQLTIDLAMAKGHAEANNHVDQVISADNESLVEEYRNNVHLISRKYRYFKLKVLETGKKIKYYYSWFLERGNRFLANEFLKRTIDDLLEEIMKIKGMDPRFFDSIRNDPFKLNLRIQSLWVIMTNGKGLPIIKENVEWNDGVPVIGWEFPWVSSDSLDKSVGKQINAHIVKFSDADVVTHADKTSIYIKSGFISEYGQTFYALFKHPLKLNVAVNGFRYPQYNLVQMGRPFQEGWIISAKTYALLEDKALQYHFFQRHAIDAPYTIILENKNMTEELIAKIIRDEFIEKKGIYRIVIKPNMELQGEGAVSSYLFDEPDLEHAANYVKELLNSSNERRQKFIIQKFINRNWEFRPLTYKGIDGKVKVKIFVLLKNPEINHWYSLDDPKVENILGQAIVNILRKKTLPFMEKVYAAIQEEYGDPILLAPDLRLDVYNEMVIQELNWGFNTNLDFFPDENAINELKSDVFKVLVKRAKENMADRAMKGKADAAQVVTDKVFPLKIRIPFQFVKDFGGKPSRPNAATTQNGEGAIKFRLDPAMLAEQKRIAVAMESIRIMHDPVLQPERILAVAKIMLDSKQIFILDNSFARNVERHFRNKPDPWLSANPPVYKEGHINIRTADYLWGKDTMYYTVHDMSVADFMETFNRLLQESNISALSGYRGVVRQAFLAFRRQITGENRDRLIKEENFLKRPWAILQNSGEKDITRAHFEQMAYHLGAVYKIPPEIHGPFNFPFDDYTESSDPPLQDQHKYFVIKDSGTRVRIINGQGKSITGTREKFLLPAQMEWLLIDAWAVALEPAKTLNTILYYQFPHNAAMIAPGVQRNTGGIDLTPANMNLQTQNGGGEIKFHLDSAMLAQLQNAPGFVPVIINIQPMNDLRHFLGL